MVCRSATMGYSSLCSLSKNQKLLIAYLSLPADFQHAKKAYQKTGKAPPSGYKRSDLDRGFLTNGLFAWSRHPNFAAEQGPPITLFPPLFFQKTNVNISLPNI